MSICVYLYVLDNALKKNEKLDFYIIQILNVCNPSVARMFWVVARWSKESNPLVDNKTVGELHRCALTEGRMPRSCEVGDHYNVC